MKDITKKLSFLLLGFALMSSLFSCENDDPVADPSNIVVEDITGDWWVIALEPDGETPAYGGDYVQFSTYATAANNTNFWLDDNDLWMELKAKVSLDPSTLTFSSVPDTEELYTGETVTITNGKFTKNSFTTPGSNTVVDEIQFEAEFSWDPGTVYVFKGYERTGKVADDNPHY
ncbi:hypothetical protein C7S20_02155 [Christiangramia fulva]|uniref:Lipid-binding hydrolase n=1 Tax=Christiangramia fulva TaxID=2126553 RepID=A0A2R3Z1N5_9FLAO|nr:lipid-binding protein [Christiangramia fulva]AVR44162.1 hypothetical protein C7S20_02155 [Christiangramia fulva]